MERKRLLDLFVSRFDEVYKPLQLLSSQEVGVDGERRRIQVRAGRGSAQALCIGVSRGAPSALRYARLNAGDQVGEGDVLVLVAPHLSEAALDFCEQLGVSCFDLSGNYLFKRGALYLRRAGVSPVTEALERRRPFARRSASIIRHLLCDTRRAWTVRALAEASGAAPAQVSRALKPLAEQEWVRVKVGVGGVDLLDPGAILSAWQRQYQPPAQGTLHFLTLSSHAQIETALAVACDALSLPYAFTAFSANARLMASLDYLESSLYVNAQPGQIKELAAHAKLKETAGQGNVTVLVCADPSIYGTSAQAGKPRLRVAHPVQVYLDLADHPQRGAEAAELLRQQLIGF